MRCVYFAGRAFLKTMTSCAPRPLMPPVSARSLSAPPRVASGDRIYAIGDVHGCFDLLEELIGRIRQDNASRAPRRTIIIQVGDMIDRGSRSAEVVDLMMRFTCLTKNLVVLKGNHEQVMVDALHGDPGMLKGWLRVGGREALESWGVPSEVFEQSPKAILKAARKAVPGKTRTWLENLPLYYQSGDFMFVHAGIRPGVPLARQEPDDLLWIAEDFLDDPEAHFAVIVHGHSIEETGPVLHPNRIALDTGAYRTGRLSAVAFEGAERWVISTATDTPVEVLRIAPTPAVVG